jgi:hypothetical protein
VPWSAGCKPQSPPGKGFPVLWALAETPGPCAQSLRILACLAPLGALGWPGFWGWDTDGVLGRRFILRSLSMIRSIVTGFRRIYEDR